MMRSAFFLLALIVSSVFGGEIDAIITGFTEDKNICAESVLDILFEKCVIDKLGASYDRRLELRGDRRLATCKDVCPEKNVPKGHWCYYCDKGRRLTHANEVSDGGNVNHCRLTAKAKKCYQNKAKEDKYQCLGDPDAIKVEVKFYKQRNE
jgi:hypothetical protein